VDQLFCENKIKAVFIDLDFTLLSHNTRGIPDSARNALKLAREQGLLLFIATGRHKAKLDVDPIVFGPLFSGYVTLNGQFCFSGDKVIRCNPIHPADVRRIVDLCMQEPFPALFAERDSYFVNMIDKTVEDAHAGVGTPLPDVRDPRRAITGDILQVGVFGGSKYRHLSQHFEHCDFVQWYWGEGGWDILPRGGNKWAGVLSVLEHFNIHPSQAATIGDCENDIEMLVNAGYSVAMGNATEFIKGHADYVTDDIDNDGLSKAITKILSIKV